MEPGLDPKELQCVRISLNRTMIRGSAMQRISLLLFSIVLLSGCAKLPAVREPETNLVEKARIGVAVEVRDKQLTVIKIKQNSPAAVAGVKLGDTIISIDGQLISSLKAWNNYFDYKQPGDIVSLVINRYGQSIAFNITTNASKYRPTTVKVANLLSDGKKVSIAVIVSDVKNSFVDTTTDWKESTRNGLQTDYESGFLIGFDYSNNFSLVDRSRFLRILDEFQLNQLGFVSEKLVAKIGEMTGATHILDVSFSRFPRQYGSHEDVTTGRLIEVESGKVVAVDRQKVFH